MEEVYCLGEAPDALQNIIEKDMRENQGHVDKCWDDPYCARTVLPECASGYIDCPAFTEDELRQILPGGPAACACGTGPDNLVMVGVSGSLSDEEKRFFGANKLIPMCMVHGVDVPPWDTVNQRPERFCFIPNDVILSGLWYGSEDLDPPAMSSRSTIFEVLPDGESGCLYELASGRIRAYLSGRFAIEFSPTCMEDGPACPVTLSYMQLDTLGFDQGHWTIPTEDGDYLVDWFSIINEKWIDGTMVAATVPGYSDILWESEVDIYMSGQTNHGLKGVRYTEAVGRSMAYEWDTRTAYLDLTLTDPSGDLSIFLRGHVIAQPPDADAGADVFVPCEQESIRLDGSGPVDVKIVNATSDEAEVSWWDSVKTQDDVTFNDSTVCMRAERTFMGFTDIDGRHYTIVLEFKDKAGNWVQGSVVVRVPMSFGEKEQQTCGDLTGLELVREDDQECFGSEGQYPPAPPPPGGCFPSSIAPREERTAGMSLFLVLGALILLTVIRLRRKK